MRERTNPAPLPDADGHGGGGADLTPAQRAIAAARQVVGHPDASHTGTASIFVNRPQEGGTNFVRVQREVIGGRDGSVIFVAAGERSHPIQRQRLTVVPNGVFLDWSEQTNGAYENETTDPQKLLTFFHEIEADMSRARRIREGEALPPADTPMTPSELEATASALIRRVVYDEHISEVGFVDSDNTLSSVHVVDQLEPDPTRTVTETVVFRRVTQIEQTILGVSPRRGVTSVDRIEEWRFRSDRTDGEFREFNEVPLVELPMLSPQGQDNAREYNISQVGIGYHEDSEQVGHGIDLIEQRASEVALMPGAPENVSQLPERDGTTRDTLQADDIIITGSGRKTGIVILDDPPDSPDQRDIHKPDEYPER